MSQNCASVRNGQQSVVLPDKGPTLDDFHVGLGPPSSILRFPGEEEIGTVHGQMVSCQPMTRCRRRDWKHALSKCCCVRSQCVCLLKNRQTKRGCLFFEGDTILSLRSFPSSLQKHVWMLTEVKEPSKRPLWSVLSIVRLFLESLDHPSVNGFPPAHFPDFALTTHSQRGKSPLLALIHNCGGRWRNGTHVRGFFCLRMLVMFDIVSFVSVPDRVRDPVHGKKNSKQNMMLERLVSFLLYGAT